MELAPWCKLLILFILVILFSCLYCFKSLGAKSYYASNTYNMATYLHRLRSKRGGGVGETPRLLRLLDQVQC